MITLHHAPGSRSCRVRWLLEELGIPYRLELLDFADGSLRSDAYLAKNPLGRVPTLEDGGLVIWESGAILEYLLESHGGGRLAPPPGSPLRPRFLQWLHFGEATLVQPLADVIGHSFLRPEGQRIPAIVPDAQERFRAALAVVERALEGREYLVGESFGAADISVGYVLQLAKLTGQLGDSFPNVAAYLERLSRRPAFQRAFSS